MLNILHVHAGNGFPCFAIYIILLHYYKIIISISYSRSYTIYVTLMLYIVASFDISIHDCIYKLSSLHRIIINSEQSIMFVCIVSVYMFN